MDNTVVVVAVIVALIVAYVAQLVLLNVIYKKTGNYLKTGRLWPALSFLGILILGLVFFSVISGNGLDAIIDMSSVFLVIFAVSAAAFVILLVRNIKGAGIGFGILLTVLQSASGIAILILGVLKVASHATAVELGNPSANSYFPSDKQVKQQAAKRRSDDRESAEAYAEHDGFTCGQEAADAGMYSGDPDLLRKD